MNWLRHWFFQERPKSCQTEIVLDDLDLGENDILVLCYSGILPSRQRDCLRKNLESVLSSDKKVLVLDDGVQLKVIRRKPNELATH